MPEPKKHQQAPLKKVKGVPFDSFRDELLQSPEAKVAYEEAQRECGERVQVDIPSQEEYEAALQQVEHLLDHDEDSPLIDVLCARIDAYESTLPEIIALHERLEAMDCITPENQYPPVEWGPDVGNEILPRELWVTLPDGRIVGIPADDFARLRCASDEQLQRYELSADGDGIHWPELGTDISVSALLAGVLDTTHPKKP